MKFPRASGILLHPTSLPGEFGIGDLGPSAYEFVDLLAEAGQKYWQILPLGPTGFGDSPYQCFSAFAGNTLLISPEMLVNDEFLDVSILNDRPDFPDDKVDFGGVYKWKNSILPEAYRAFHQTTSVDLRGRFEKFNQENGWWLEDYAAFRAIKAEQKGNAWYKWPDPLKLRIPEAVAAESERLYEQIQSEKLYQFIFYLQWGRLKDYATSKGIQMIGDIPIFVALDSSDVWCNQDKFKLNIDGSPKVVAGVPPDYFSKTGQLWGNPIYDWDAMRNDGFGWWISRVAATLRTVDIVRVDHFRGFAAAWEVPGGDETAENGRWVEVPGRELFSALNQALGELPIIAEDLGVITPDVEELRDGFGFPGMRILQFAFGGDAKNHDLPHNYIENCIAYTGTHDNDTTVGWWFSQAGAGSTRNATDISHEHDFCLKYLDTDGTDINWDLIRALWASVGHTAIAPLQDIIGLGTEGRMNLPASTSGNWVWRFRNGAISAAMVAKLRELTETYGRL
ncbi:MAG: 4-alpha-glucanotransferase [Pyrinomonadaceae bacterium]